MNVFDIIGPVMIVPSSSHTAGAVRLGRVANKLIDGRALAKVEITLSGSFARTFKGHGTDRALLTGIMGYHSYSREIRDALEIAKERGIAFSFLREDIRDAHPNTARIRYFLKNGEEGVMQGASVGGSMAGSLKETARGGLAATPTGMRLQKQVFGDPAEEDIGSV